MRPADGVRIRSSHDEKRSHLDPSRSRGSAATLLIPAVLLAMVALLSGCSADAGLPDPMQTDDANPSSFRPLFDATLAALDQPSKAELPALKKLFPHDSTDDLEDAVQLCGNIDPGTRKLDLLKSLDPYHLMTGHITGRKRDSSTRVRCGLALMWTAGSISVGRHWEIQAWSLRATASPAPTPDK